MADPLAQLWPHLTDGVQAALASAHRVYGRLSTSKAVAGLRGLGGPAATALDEMADDTKVPKPVDVDRGDTSCPDELNTSPCVRHTASTLLEGAGDRPVDDGAFLATLADVSVGKTASRWKRAGFDGDRVAELIARARG